MADPTLSTRGVALDIAEVSRIGGRSSNQDACARSDNGALVCLVVADGAGGHEGGEIASALAVQAVIGAFERSPGCTQALLRALIARATLDVQQQKIGRPQLAAMSATVATVLLDRAQGQAAWAHLGDTRIYLFRNGRVLHATRDHSLVQQLIDGGLAVGADPRTHKRRNVLYAAIGAESDVPPSLQPPLALLPGDAILICSDGLWEWVTEDVMEACLAVAGGAGAATATAQAWLDALCAAADQASAASADTRDNYTAQAVIVGGAMSASQNCLAIGTRLAEFEIQSVIGEGGFGIVYLAFDHSLQRTVAVKEYMPASLAARGDDHSVSVRSKRNGEAFEAGLRSFINEARLLAQFDHPALVKVYRFWEQNSTAYMAMRYYEGQTFKTLVRNEPAVVDEAWLRRILKSILEALDALYKTNILHRDISPENIMIQPGGDAVLLDFGAARQIVTGMSQSLTVILKPGYAPVEQYADDESMRQGAWTDIYSLSAVVYSAIAQKAPPAAVARMLKDPITPLASEPRAGYSAPFLAAIDRGMCVRPEERPQTIAEFALLLGIELAEHTATQPGPARSLAPALAPAAPGMRTTARAGAGATADSPAVAAPVEEPSRPAPSPVPPARSRRPALIGGVAGALALLVAAGLYAAGGDTPVATAQPVAAVAPPASQAPVAPTEPAAPEAPAVAAAAPAPAAVEATPQQPVKPAVTTGTVTLNIQPWANVSVDGVAKGPTPPLKKLSLPEGLHQIKIDNPNFPEHVITVTVAANKSATVKYDFSAH